MKKSTERAMRNAARLREEAAREAASPSRQGFPAPHETRADALLASAALWEASAGSSPDEVTGVLPGHQLTISYAGRDYPATVAARPKYRVTVSRSTGNWALAGTVTFQTRGGKRTVTREWPLAGERHGDMPHQVSATIEAEAAMRALGASGAPATSINWPRGKADGARVYAFFLEGAAEAKED